MSRAGIVKSSKILEDFIDENPELCRGLKYEDVRDICYTPYNVLRKEMSKGDLKSVSIKYVGKFIVYTGKVAGILRHLTKRFKLNKVEHKSYFKQKELIENYFKRIGYEEGDTKKH